MKKSRRLTEYLLSEAVEKFTRSRRAASLKQVKTMPMPNAIAGDPTTLFQNVAGHAGDLVHAVISMSGDGPARQETLRKDIEKGKFIATGRRIDNPKMSPDRVIIAADLFSKTADIDWANSRICSAGLTFDIVRISRARQSNKQFPVPAYEYVKSTQPGRPSKEKEILDIIAEIDSTGYQFNKAVRKTDFERIRNHARKKLGINQLKGYSDPILQRIIFRKFGRRN
jgi:hypothetical protein